MIEKNRISGKSSPFLIAGPCAVEDYNMLDQTIKYLLTVGVANIRANVFKPRTSPHSFQGIGMNGLEILSQLKQIHKVSFISEVVDIRHIEIMADYIDVFQVGSRNMGNFELLKELGKFSRPVLLKRGMSATIDEFAYAAEYITQGGNKKVYLCERGIRSFDYITRNILDLTCVPLIKSKTRLPIVVDLSHSLGRKDIIVEMGRAALACGADGLMVEVHPTPERALSDSRQQLNFAEFGDFYDRVFISNN